MEYKFKIIEHKLNKGDSLLEYGVERESLSEEIKSLYHITWSGWTPQKIQNIIDEISELSGDAIYEHQVTGSDLLISVDIQYAYFFDWRTQKETEDFYWSTEDFINFLEDFKAFIEENR